MSRTRVSTRWILVLGALAAVQAVLIVAFGPLGTTLALASPPIYAAAAWVTVLIVATACHFDLRPGMITLIGLAAAICAMPFSVLGILLIPFIGVQALVMEVAAHLARRLGTWPRALIVSVAGQTVAYFGSLVVFDPESLVPLVLTLVALGRLTGAVLLTLASTFIARGLRSARLDRSIEGRS